MLDHRSVSQHQHTLEVGPGGIHIRSTTPSLAQVPSPSSSPRAGLSLAVRHPRLLAAGLLVVDVAALIGPLVVILGLELPLWLLLGPVLMSVFAVLGAAAIAGGRLAAVARAYDQPEIERRIIDLAARVGGRLTVALTAHELSMSLTEAEHALMALARAGHVDIDNDPDSAAVLYVFRDLATQLHPSRSPVGLRP